MKKTMSKDGIPRYTVWVSYRIADEEREVIAWVADCEKLEYGQRPTKLRLATHKEIVRAIQSGYDTDMEWQDEYVSDYWRMKEGKPPEEA